MGIPASATGRTRNRGRVLRWNLNRREGSQKEERERSTPHGNQRELSQGRKDPPGAPTKRDQPPVRIPCEKGPDADGQPAPDKTSSTRAEKFPRGTRAGTFRPQKLPEVKKRERPDDTTSPNDQAKKSRIGSGQKSYARAAQEIPAELSLAITLQPPRDLTNEEAEKLKEALHNRVFDQAMATAESNTILPSFRRCPHLREGSLYIWCEDEFAVSWLREQAPTLLEIPNYTLTVTKQSDIPTRVRAVLFIPGYIGDIPPMYMVLKRQNPHYDMNKWSLYRCEVTQNKRNGTVLFLGIPRDEVDKLLARGRRVAYSYGSIYVRFLVNGKLLDQPPPLIQEPRSSASAPARSVPGPNAGAGDGEDADEMEVTLKAEQEGFEDEQELLRDPSPTDWTRFRTPTAKSGRGHDSDGSLSLSD